MPKFIFNKNDEVTEGRLVFIAKDQAHIDDNAGWELNLYEIVDVSQSDFDSVKLYQKYVTYDGTNITYIDQSSSEQTQEQYDIYKNNILKSLNYWLEKNSNKPFTTNVTNYRDYLISFDVSGITSPKRLEKHLNDQGQEVINVLELI
tara:strand:- start:1956 stop:2396 length:441 start_codon:yes stop_codon:yes gene_type:complete